MIRWTRVVLPFSGMIASLLFIYAGLVGFELYIEWKLGQAIPFELPPSLCVLFVGAVLYGLYRVFAFHPIRRPFYRAWLETTPWTSRKPLPLGPIHLVAQDLLIIGVTFVVAWPLHHAKVAPVLQVFLITYLLSMSFALWWTGEGLSAFSVWFSLGSMIYTWTYFPLFVVLAGCTYGLAYWGLRQSLARFPWPLTQWMRTIEGRQPTQLNQSWPYSRLAPKFIPNIGISIQMSILTCLLISWIYFVVLSLVKGPDKLEAALNIFFILTIPAIGGRLLIYLAGYLPPISFWGRIATGRWIIPGFDQVFIAPLLALIVSFWMPKILTDQGFGFVEARTISLAWVYFLVLILGPSLKAWRLTGNHRIVSPQVRVG